MARLSGAGGACPMKKPAHAKICVRFPSGLVASRSWKTAEVTMLRISIFLLFAISAFAQRPAFTVGWSVYAGWTPYSYMNKSGLLRKWADKYGITIKVQRFDYAPSLDAFVARNIDACTMTNMEALDMPAA